MANPTRLQIEATFAKPTFRIEVLTPTLDPEWLIVNGARVITASGESASTDNTNGVAFGSPSTTSATIQLEDYAIVGYNAFSHPSWIGENMRVSFGFDTSDFVIMYQGPIISIDKDNETVTIQLGSALNYLKDTKIHTPVYYRKPAATRTTAISVEDPEDVNFVGGMINMAFWYSGGRPYEQKDTVYTETDPDWKFWYSCEQSLITPDFSWFSGENLQDEVFNITRATGGQLYQDMRGVIRYVQPLSFGDTTNYLTHYRFTETVYDGYAEHIDAKERVGRISLTYTPRRIEPEQQILEDTTPRFFAPNETKDIELTPNNPIWDYIGLIPNNTITAVNTMQASLFDGRSITPGVNDITKNAQQVIISIWNSDLYSPMLLSSITIKGQPLGVTEDQTVVYGTDIPERQIENNPYVQNQAHAERLARMIYDFYVEGKPIITLSNCIFDPDRYVGEIVQLTSQYNLTYDTNALYRIIRIAHQDLGTTMQVELVHVSNLPNRGQMLIIGQTYSDSDIKYLSY